jgi:hypothetical protein
MILEGTLTAGECQLLADVLSEEAVGLPAGSKREARLKLALVYRDLARIKKALVGNRLAANWAAATGHNSEVNAIDITAIDCKLS